MINNLTVGQALYEYLKDNITDLPEYRYNITNILNGGLVFQQTETTQKYFNEENKPFAFNIYYFADNQDASHLEQLQRIEEIKTTLNNIKTLNVDGVEVQVLNIIVNDIAQPQIAWTNWSLDSFDLSSQIYTLKIELVIRE